MSTIRVSEAAVSSVRSACEESASRCLGTAGWLTSSGLAHSAVTVLTGHGLAAAALAAQIETIAVRAAAVGHELSDDAEIVSSYGKTLLGSQAAPTRRVDWLGLSREGVHLLLDLRKDGGRLAKAAEYAWDGTLHAHATRWARFGDYHQAFVGVPTGIAAVYGALFPDAAGRLVSAGGQLAGAVSDLGTVVRYGDKYTRFLGGKIAGPFALLAAGQDIVELSTTDYQNLIHGDAEGHSARTREALYGAKAVDAAGNLLMAAALVPSPASPVLAASGAVLIGTSALINGAVAVGDYLHEHPEQVREITSTAASAWKAVSHPRLPHLL